MKKLIKLLSLIVLSTLSLSSCVKDDDFETPSFKETLFKETFNPNELNDDEFLDYNNWTSFAEAGTYKWFEKVTDGNGYIEFSGYLSGEASNIAWAITPKITLVNPDQEILTFKTASEYVTSSANKIEVFISSDFDGTNVLAATWTPVPATLANNSTNITSDDSNGYINIYSGEIDLSNYSGDIYIGFRATGSGTNLALDGSLRLDDIKIFDKNLL